MSRIERTRRARVDVQQIWNYVAERNAAAADRIVARIDGAVRMLANNPAAGESAEDARRNTRKFSVGVYVVFFEPTSTGIRVIRVLHSSRDLTDLFDD